MVRATKYSPGLLSLLPLFYVAWADTVLSPSEMNLIHKKVNLFKFLNAEEKKLILSWTNPAQMPDEKVFRSWISAIKEGSKGLSLNRRISLAELGWKLAQNHAAEIDDSFDSTTLSALQDLEESLDVSAESSKQLVFNKLIDIKISDSEPSIPVNPITKALDGDQHVIKNRVRVLLRDPVFAHQHLRKKSKYRKLILNWLKILANQGLGSISYPKEYGGEDDMAKYASAFEVIAHHDLSLCIKFGVQFGLFGGAILNLGTKLQHDKYLKKAGTLEIPGCFAMTESGHGSNVRGLETTATYDHESQCIIIHTPHEKAGKEYIGNALHGKMAVVFAQLIVAGKNHGIHAIVAPLRDELGALLEGIRIEDNGYKMGLNGVDNGKIWFDHIRVPKENLLNRFGDISGEGQYLSQIENPSKRFFTMLGTLVGGRIAVGKGAVSGLKSALNIAIKYAIKRKQFGPNEASETLLMDYPSHQRRLLIPLSAVYGLSFALNDLVSEYQANRKNEDIREIETKAAGLKAYATWVATAGIQECREACGGRGYLSENRLGDIKADTDIFTTFEGDNTVLYQLVAKGLLSEFKEEFHNEGVMAVIRYLGERVGTTLSELNPYTSRKTDADHLLDPDFHLSTFQYHERKLQVSLAQRMQRLLRQRVNPYDAFLRGQTHMISAANAYAENLVLKSFIAKVNSIEDQKVKSVLKSLCDLYALATIEKNKGWYLETGYFEGIKSKAIRRMVNKLCQDLRANAEILVDAFAIPKALLGTKME